MSLPFGVTFTVGTLDLSAEPDLGLVTSGSSPGGFKQATWTMCRAGAGGIEIGDHVRIFDTTFQRYAFLGQVKDVNKRGSTYNITAVRSTAFQTYRQEKVYQSGTPHVVAIQDALSLCEAVFDGGIVDPGSQFVAKSNNYAGRTAEQVWQDIFSLTNSLTTPLTWHIRGSISGLQLCVIAYQDNAARYFAAVPEDQIQENYTLDAIINRSSVGWGNEQYVTIPPSGTPVSYTAIKILHDRYADSSRTITRQQDAEGLAGNYLSRFGQFRSVNDSIVLKCNEQLVRCVPPILAAPSDAYPLWLVESGYGIHLNNRPASEAPYNVADKFIVGNSYNWDTGELTLTCGETVDIGSDINWYESYNVNRLYYGPASSAPPRWTNHPLADADLIPVFGPNMPGDTPPSFVTGLAIFTRDDSGELQFERVIHPGLIADEGIEINANVGIDEARFMAAAKAIPGTLTNYEVLLIGSTGLVDDTCTIVLHRINSTGIVSLLGVPPIVCTSKRTVGLIPSIVLNRGDKVMFQISVASGTAAADIAAIALHGTKAYPGLKL